MSYKWVASTQASILFGVGAIFTVLLTAFSFEPFGIPDHVTIWDNIVGGVTGVVGTLSLFLLWTGMRKYHERREWEKGKKSRWIRAFLFIGFWWSATIYYLLVYLPTRKRTVKIEKASGITS